LRHPTADELAALAATHGDRLELLENETIVLVVKPPTREHYADYMLGVALDRTTPAAERNLIERCTVWPGRSEVEAVMRDRPGASEEIAGALDAMVSTPAKRRPLDTLTEDEIASLRALGCDLDALRAKHSRPGQLVSLESLAGLWVLRRPSVASYDLYREGKDGAQRYAARHALTLESVAWPDEETVRAALERFPGVALVASAVLEQMASGGATRRKKISSS
jgi:hypothetical protein